MKLEKLQLTNFRCFKDEAIDCSAYTAIVGPNNSGKSTIFKAIDLFFRTTQKSNPLVLTDFHEPKSELRIILTFSGLPAKAIEEFSHYHRHGKLEFFIKASANSNGNIDASVHGRRMGIKAFGGFFSADGASGKKAFYINELRQAFPELPELSAKGTVGAFETALLEYEVAHAEQHEMIESEDLAFGASGVASRLRKYVDWVYIPAVKDAATEEEEAKNNAFGILVNRIIRARVKVDEKIAAIRSVAQKQISELVGDYGEEVKKLEGVLDTEFRRLTSTDAHIHLDWAPLNDNNVSLNLPLVRSILSDETFRGEISKFGHGLQRNYLTMLVHLNAKFALADQPSIILACEEPELYQHPPQARYLHIALQKISETDQVLITTHSPYFISARTFENVRLVRKSAAHLSKVSKWTVEQHRNLIAQAFDEKPIGIGAAQASLEPFIQPELNEAFFCGKLVLVEGLEDRAILTTALEHANLLTEFVRCGGHIVGVNGKGGLINMIALARGFETPHFVIFDADTACKPDAAASNKALNTKILSLLELAADKYAWPEEDYFDDRAIIWKVDVQSAISRDYDGWYGEVKGVCAAFGWQYERLSKNPAVLSHALQGVFASGKKIACLQRAAESLMTFAKK